MLSVTVFITLFCLVCSYEDKTVVEYLRDNGGDYSTLYSLVASANLAVALSAPGPFTVFAPTNAAFAKVDPATLSSLQSNPAQLASVLKYHVVPEFVLIPTITGATKKMTLDGRELDIARSGGTLSVNNAATVDSTPNNDIIVNNGVVQPIDSVLLPPVMGTLNIAQILLQRDDKFKDLFLALLLADLTSVLETGDYTVFAPNDAAFGVYKDNLLSPTQTNAQAVYQEVLKYHVVQTGMLASALKTGTLMTLHGTAINVTVSATGVMVNQANVLEADIISTNGVIHEIDSILVPSDISQVAQG